MRGKQFQVEVCRQKHQPRSLKSDFFFLRGSYCFPIFERERYRDLKVEKNQTMEQGGLKMKARGLKMKWGAWGWSPRRKGKRTSRVRQRKRKIPHPWDWKKDDQVPCFETEISRDCALTHHQMTSGFTVKEMWSMEVMHLARREWGLSRRGCICKNQYGKSLRETEDE